MPPHAGTPSESTAKPPPHWPLLCGTIGFSVASELRSDEVVCYRAPAHRSRLILDFRLRFVTCWVFRVADVCVSEWVSVWVCVSASVASAANWVTWQRGASARKPNRRRRPLLHRASAARGLICIVCSKAKDCRLHLPMQLWPLW